MDARERLIERAAGRWVSSRSQAIQRKRTGDTLDMFLAHPDDLLELLVERGALERRRTSRNYLTDVGGQGFGEHIVYDRVVAADR